MNNKYVNTNDNVNIVEISCRLVSAKKFESGAGFITGYVKNGTDVFPRIYCPKEVYKEFKKHSRIKVIGHISSRVVRENGKFKRTQQIVADSLELEQTLTEDYFGIKGKFFKDFTVSILLKGKLKSINRASGWSKLVLNIPTKTNPNNTVIVNMKDIDRPIQYSVGDTICAVCGLSTPQKVINEKNVIYEDIVVSDLAVEKAVEYA